MVKKLVCLVSAALIVLFVFASCGEEKKPLEEVSLYRLSKAMLEADTFPEMITVGSSDSDAADKFLYLSDVDYGKIDGYFLSYAKDGAGYELAVVAAKDEADVREIENSLVVHLEGRINLYKNYSPEDLPLAKAAKVGSLGRYVYLIMCRDTDAVKGAMEKMILG